MKILIGMCSSDPYEAPSATLIGDDGNAIDVNYEARDYATGNVGDEHGSLYELVELYQNGDYIDVENALRGFTCDNCDADFRVRVDQTQTVCYTCGMKHELEGK